MKVRVRLFAMLRERAGAGELELDLPDGATVGAARTALGPPVAGVPAVAAVNREYVRDDHRLQDGDELALVPPVSGGDPAASQPPRCLVALGAEPLDAEALRRAVLHPGAGAVVVFCGTTRDVPALEYEAYAEMAVGVLQQIGDTAIAEFGLTAAAVAHRVGTVPREESSVVCAASAPHREAAFLGARALIDRIKEQAPIWKQEEGEWVAGQLPEV